MTEHQLLSLLWIPLAVSAAGIAAMSAAEIFDWW